jgi:hypothetical protein
MKSFVVSRQDESAGAQVVVWAGRLLCGLGIIALSLLCLVCLLPVALVVDMVREAPTKRAQFRQDGYAARMERVAPTIPGLIVEFFPSVNGALKITNRTGQVVYVAPSDTLVHSKAGWVEIPPDQEILVTGDVEYRGWRDRLPMGDQPGQVMKSWVVQGRVGDTGQLGSRLEG